MSDGETKLSASAQRVQKALRAKGVSLKVVELPASTRTAQEAADAVGCEVGQIVKSLVFGVGDPADEVVLILTSGSNRVDEIRLGAQLGQQLAMAPADAVREKTGFAIGGVPPVGHTSALKTYIDEDLMSYEFVWAAAGTPRAVFRITPSELARITQGEIMAVT